MAKVWSFTQEELELSKDDDRPRGYWVDKGDDKQEYVPDGFKCGGCNWECSKLYAYTETREEAKAAIEAQELGMCGECMTEFLAEQD